MRHLLIAFLPALALAQFPPHSGYEPPAAEKAQSLADSTQAAPKPFLTLAETSNYQKTGQYDESLALYRAFAKASPIAKLVTLGTSPEGRDIVMLIVSKDRAFTPEAAAKTGKPVVLIQNGIHAGEIAGKDATAMLLRDLLISKRLASLLDHAIVLAIPVFNVDGFARFGPYNRINQNGPVQAGWRATGQRYNLNRDYLKADTPEMRAWLAMYTKWLPDFLIDNHVTDGEDHQYDITYNMATGPDVAPTLADWSRDRFLPKLLAKMESDGHVVAPYGSYNGDRDGYRGASFQPRFSNGYTAIQNRVGLLVETHSLKSFRTRIWAHYDLMRHVLELMDAEGRNLRTAVTQADLDVAKMAGGEIKIHLDGTIGKDGVAFDYKGLSNQQQLSPLTNGFYTVYFDVPINTSTMLYDELETTVAEAPPVAYAIPRQWTVLIDLLHLHGVRTETLPADRHDTVTATRLLEPKWTEKPFEGHHRVEFRTERHDEPQTLPAGTVIVPMHQRAARVAMNILEPDAPDSAVRWGLLDTIFEQKEYAAPYVLEPMAQAMKQDHDELRVAYEKRLREDPAFAADPAARRRWWYDRSPYREPDLQLYPVLRLSR